MSETNDMRSQAVQISTDFKKSWIQIAELLTKVASEKLYEEWGFKKFEDYCKIELKIKKSTAMKLTNAFFFLTNEEPELIEKGLDLDVVSALQKVKNDDMCSTEVFEELKNSAVSKGRSGATIQKAYKDSIKEEENKVTSFYRKTQSMTRQLKGRINPVDDIPERFTKSLTELSEFLEEQIKFVGVS